MQFVRPRGITKVGVSPVDRLFYFRSKWGYHIDIPAIRSARLYAAQNGYTRSIRSKLIMGPSLQQSSRLCVAPFRLPFDHVGAHCTVSHSSFPSSFLGSLTSDQP